MNDIKSLLASWKQTILIGTLILFLAFALRIINLTQVPVFVDEAIYIHWARVISSESTLRFIPQASEGKQPLFMWIVAATLSIFSDPLVAGRIVSVMAGIGSLIGIFLTSYVIFKNKALSLVAAAMYAVSPFTIFFDRLALVDSTLTMFAVWTFLFATITIKTLRLDVAMLTGFALGGALLTKSTAILFIAVLPVLFLLADWPKLRLQQAMFLVKRIGLLVVSLVIALGMYNVLRLGPGFEQISIQSQKYLFPLSHIITNPFDPFIFHLRDILEWLNQLGPYLFLPLIVLGLITIVKNKSKEGVVLLLLGLLPLLAVSVYAKVFTARYILYTVPYFILTASLPYHLLKGRAKKVFISFLACYFLVALVADLILITMPEKLPLPRSERSGYFELWTAGTGTTEVVAYIEKQRRIEPPTRNITIGTEGNTFGGTFPDALQIYFFDSAPHINIKPLGISFTEVPDDLIKAKLYGDKVYLVVNDSRFFIDNPEQVGLHLIKSFPKATQPNGITEKLLFFELIEVKN